MRRTVLFFIWLLPLTTVFPADLRVVGSDLLGADFAAALVTFSKQEKLSLTTTFAGSRAGLEALKAGAADVALVALAPDEKLPGAPWAAFPLAYRVAVVAAPAHIGLAQISFVQLDGFFGASGPAGYTLWRDVGVDGPAGQLSVTTHVLEGKTDGVSIDIFSHAALRVPRLKSAVMRHTEFVALKERLATEAGGLAILSDVPPAGSGLRTLLIAKAEGDPAYGPTPENIHTGDYPLRLPIYVVYRVESTGKLKALLAFLWSDTVAQSLSHGSKCVPVPNSGRPTIR